MHEKTTKVLVIGSGPAGYTAAIYAARAGLSPILLEGLQPGGQLMITNEVENYPPFASTTGPILMDEMRSHAQAAGAEILPRIADSVARMNDSSFTVQMDDGRAILAQAVILATGATAKWLGVPGEEEFMGRGVSACATCDGFFYKGKNVLVIGGGNTAVEEALYLSGLAARVTLLCRGEALKAERILQDRLFALPNVGVVWQSQIQEVVGDETGVTAARVAVRGQVTDMTTDGIFVAIGHSPATGLVRDLVDLDAGGYVAVKPGSTLTTCPGLFAAGDVGDPVYRQAITSAGFGCMAALDAERYLSRQH